MIPGILLTLLGTAFGFLAYLIFHVGVVSHPSVLTVLGLWQFYVPALLALACFVGAGFLFFNR